LLRRAPQVLLGLARQGHGMDAVRRQAGRTPALPTSQQNQGAQEAAATGRFFFGYFLLATQKKVARLPVREPA